MFFVDVLFALFFALLLAAIFGLAFRSRGPWGSIWLFFLILFLATWAGGVWVTPIGAPVWGAYWIPFLFVAIIFALILSAAAAAAAVPEEETTVEMVDEQRLEQEERATTATLGIFFWILMVVLIIAIIAAYV